MNTEWRSLACGVPDQPIFLERGVVGSKQRAAQARAEGGEVSRRGGDSQGNG